MKHDCFINCPDHACKKAEIQGPRGADFTMICDGNSACIDAKVESERAVDVVCLFHFDCNSYCNQSTKLSFIFYRTFLVEEKIRVKEQAPK